MLTKYERHLFESLVTVQELLNVAMDNNDRLEKEIASQAKEKEKLNNDLTSLRTLWMNTYNQKNELEKELAELKASLEKEESDVPASNSSNEKDLQEAI